MINVPLAGLFEDDDDYVTVEMTAQ